MSYAKESTFFGGARPKTTTVVEGRKSNKKSDHQIEEVKSLELKQTILPSVTCKCDETEIDCNCGKVNVWNEAKFKPIWNKPYKDTVQATTDAMSYDCGSDNDFSTNSVKLFRTKQPCLTSMLICPNSVEDQTVTGSLLNLSLNPCMDNRLCNGASDILHDEFCSARSSNDFSPPCCHSNISCKSEPQAMAKWKTAGLALRQLLSKKSNKNKRPNKLHKQHERSDHRSCWLQRLRDFDEYDEEYFTCCTCDDTEEATKTDSSSNLISVNLKHLPMDIQDDISEGQDISSYCTSDIINEPKSTYFNTCKMQNSLLMLFDTSSTCFSNSTREQNASTWTEHSEPLSDTICNSIVWEMLQKPYTMSSHGDNIDSQLTDISSSFKSQNICDTLMCNNVNFSSVNDSIPQYTATGVDVLSAHHTAGTSTSIIQNKPFTTQTRTNFYHEAEGKHVIFYHEAEVTSPVIHRSVCEHNVDYNICEQAVIQTAINKPDYSDRNGFLLGNSRNCENPCESEQCFVEPRDFLDQSNLKFDKNSNKSQVNSVFYNTVEVTDDLLETQSSIYNNKLLNTSCSNLPHSCPEPKSIKDEQSETECRCCTYYKSSLSQPLLSSLTASDLSNNSSHNELGGLNLNSHCEMCAKTTNNHILQKCRMCNNYHQPQSILDISTSSLSENNEPNHIKCIVKSEVLTKPNTLCESESELTDCSSLCSETSREIYFSEGTDSSDLPSKFLRLNPTKGSTEYCAHSTNREKKKKVLHIRKCHHRSGSTSSDLDDDKLQEIKGDTLIAEESNDPYKFSSSFLLSEILHPSTPLARFLKSHNDEQSSSMPWENIEDGLSVESCADGDSNPSLTDMLEKSTLRSNSSLFKITPEDELLCNISEPDELTLCSQREIDTGLEYKSMMQDRPSTTLRKLLNMEIHTELKGDNSQYSPETWVRLVDQISLPFECAEEDGNNDMITDNTLVDSMEKSNEFGDLCLPNYDSSASCDADDEFECDCEHCQLLKSMGNTDDINTTNNNTSTQNNSSYTWPDFLEDDTSLELDLSELRPLEPLLTNLQDIPQDLIDLMFQNVIMQMLAVHPELMGDQAPPPVPQYIIDCLPVILTTQLHIDQEVSCPICLCLCQLDESLTRLCCQHLFHPLCIQAWLAKSGTCPVCRCTINGE